MSAGFLLLSIAAVLVFCGLLQRVLDRMYMTDRQALLLIGAMLAGTFLPNLQLGWLELNVGGALIPLAVCVYILVRSDSNREKVRAIIGSVTTGAAIYGLSVLLPGEAEALWIDPMWLYGLFGGVIAWLLARSRRAAFICGVSGVLLADVVNAIVNGISGYESRMILGGAGIADAAVVSGVMAVLLCEVLGEMIERLAKRTRRGEA